MNIEGARRRVGPDPALGRVLDATGTRFTDEPERVLVRPLRLLLSVIGGRRDGDDLQAARTLPAAESGCGSVVLVTRQAESKEG